MIVSTRSSEPFPPEIESRLEDFTELLATAISNASAHDRLRRLADEQAALRRVATLVAQQTPQAELFTAIAGEIGELLGVDSIEMIRYEEERFAAAAAGWGHVARAVPDGTRVLLGGRNVISLVFRTQRAARVDDYGDSSGPIAARVSAGGVRSAVGAPIFVDGRLWGAMIAASMDDEGLLPDTEAHRPVHRPDGHGDRRHRVTRRGRAAGGGAGGAPARGHARRAGRLRLGRLRGGHCRGQGALGGRGRRTRPLRR